MLQPKSYKYRKQHRGRLKGIATKGINVSFGEFGLKAQESSWITARQIEAARRVMTRYTRKGGKIWIRIFPDKPYTKKPAETRQGGGKGPVEGWVALVKPGRVMYEVGGVPGELAREALARAAQKLPVQTRMVSREEPLQIN